MNDTGADQVIQLAEIEPTSVNEIEYGHACRARVRKGLHDALQLVASDNRLAITQDECSVFVQALALNQVLRQNHERDAPGMELSRRLVKG